MIFSKKAISLLGSAILILFLSACGGGSTDGGSNIELSSSSVGDSGYPLSSSSLQKNSSSSLDLSSSSIVIIGGTFTDARDNKEYKWVEIGSQTWMAENLNYVTTIRSWCYDNDESNCAQYGRLYYWATAMNLPDSCVFQKNEKECSSQIQTPHQGICPAGWHLPSNVEWTTLLDFTGGSSVAGIKLKSATGWDGTDDYGFNALPGGRRFNLGGAFREVRTGGYWWTVTEYGSGTAYYRRMSSEFTFLSKGDEAKNNGLSVRCVKDN
ncbi:MAG: fibrobacter succinogenes major paralogous domain-containing protein [Fibrobacter sp.]|jgi:uncharacterized protein (TIGR02145 family)|nr:fibrobacter succinogenes major paralogous domain-containing protein [Fibrobacter sp.]